MVKKTSLISTLFVCLVAIFVSIIKNSATVVHADNNLTVLFSTTYEEENKNFYVTANLVNNSGINAATFELTYDNNVFELVGFEKGTALNSLNLLTTNTNTDLGYSIMPFKFSWWSQELQNDYSVGTLVVMQFKVKDNVNNGDYTISFACNEGDVTYNGTEVKRPSINGTRIHIRNHYVDSTDNEIPSDDSSNALLVVLLSIAGLAIISIALLFVFRRKKRKNWVKIS